MNRHQEIINMSKFVRSQGILSNNRSHMIGCRDNNSKRELTGVRSHKINNISCFVHYLIDEEARTCTFEIHSRLRPGHISCEISDIDPKTFEVAREIAKLRLNMDDKPLEEHPKRPTIHERIAQREKVSKEKAGGESKKSTDRMSSVDLDALSFPGGSLPPDALSNNFRENEFKNFGGYLSASHDPNWQNCYVSTDEESMFFKIPSMLMSYVEGFHTQINQVLVDYDEENDMVKFCATEDQAAQAKKRFAVDVPLDKVFKLLEGEGISKDNVDDELFSIKNRNKLIVRALSAYIKKHLQVTEYDPSLQEPLTPANETAAGRAARRLSKQRTKKDVGEKVYTLVNNDGNQIRRPKIIISLLDHAQLLER